MNARRTRKPSPELRVQIRVWLEKNIAIGPGKAELLGHIAETGSIREAAARMEMSYMRAWSLVQTMNSCFKHPLVTTARGGKAHGGALITDHGQEALNLYRKIERQAQAVAESNWRRLEAMLRCI